MATGGTGIPRGDYLIRNGAVITVDPELGTLPRADVLVRDGTILEIGADLAAGDAETIDASDMIVMPGLIDTHYHMWSTIGRNFLNDDGFEYFPAKWATAGHYGPNDFHNSVLLGLVELASGGVTCVHNWSHNNRSPAHVDGELEAHRKSYLRARYSLGHVDRMPVDEVNRFDDLDRVQGEWFADDSRLERRVHLGINLRGTVQSEPRVFHEEMQDMLRRDLAVSIHANQTRPSVDDDAADYEKRGYLGPKFLFCHYLWATDSDREAMARTGTPLSYATHSELRLGDFGDARASLMKARAAGVSISLSSDASSIAPPNMFENMRLTWNMCIPWKETDTEDIKPLGFVEAIEMATINGAKALGLGDVTGSLTPGKRADLILIRTTDINISPVTNIETAVVQSATPANVDTVMVDGRIVKRGGELTAYDVPAIVARAQESALRVRSASGGSLTPTTDGCGNPLHRGRAH